MDNEDFFTDHEEDEEELQEPEEDNSSGEPDEDTSDPISESEDDSEFNILSSEDIRRRVNENLSEISTLLSVTNPTALLMLCKYGWNVSKVHEEWFSDETKTRKNCGLMVFDKSDDDQERETKRSKTGFFCGICLENYYEYTVDHGRVTAACGHAFCETCWKTYISTSIQDGPGCLTLKCPQPKCGASVGDMIEDTSLVCPDDRSKYEEHSLRSYVESRKNLKWCPFPGCDFTVECLSRGFGSNMDVTCNCSHKFCWNCSEEIHTPADCETVAKWMTKNSSESENTNWILSNTKPCPKCHRPIEKNEGCMHMTCKDPCGFHFCWLCLGPWSEHNRSYYRCNRFDEDKKTGKYNEAEKIREMARSSLVKYTHYFERWMGNENSRKMAVESMKKSWGEQFEKLGGMFHLTAQGWEFVPKAWAQVVECRRVLKWSYAYGYYLTEVDPDKKEFFEHQQGLAESQLERLHEMVESELPKLTQKLVPADTIEFTSFCTRVEDLTTITRNQFNNLITGLANDRWIDR